MSLATRRPNHFQRAGHKRFAREQHTATIKPSQSSTAPRAFE